jgi:vancomycin resistance protein YoaR
MKLSRRRKVAIGLTLVVVTLGILLGGVAAAQDDRVMRGIKVNGIPLVGMNGPQVQERLRVAGHVAQLRPITLLVEDRRWSRSPSEMGLSIDLTSTVVRALAAGRDNPFTWFLHTIGARDDDLPWVTSVNKPAFDSSIEALAAEVNIEASNGEVLLEGTNVVARPPSVGVVLNEEKASKKLIEAASRMSRAVALPVTTSKPDVGEDQVERVRLEAEGLLARDFTFHHSESNATAVLPRDALARALRTHVSAADPGPLKLELSIDPAALEDQLTSLMPAVATAAKDALFKVSGDSVSVVPSVNGKTIDAQAAITAMMAVKDSQERPPVVLTTIEKPPAFTTDQANSFGIKERVSSFSTTFDPTNAPRVKNIDLMAEAIDGSVVAPGEVFSLNGTTGPRTPENGYQEAQIIVDGELVPGIGGGVCQVATTVFNAAYSAGLDIRERINHSLYISKYPVGRDATVNFGLQDLQFRNDTPHGVLLTATVTRRGVTVSIFSTKLGRVVETSSSQRRNPKEPPVKYVDDPGLPQGQEVVTEEGSPGFDITVTRKVIENGQEIHSDEFVSRYRAWKRIIRRGTGPAASPSPSPSPPQS